MTRRWGTGRIRLVAIVGVACVFCVALGAGSPAAWADDAPQCPAKDAYGMMLGALTGPADTELRLTFTADAGCAAVAVSKHVQIKVRGGDDKVVSVMNLFDVAVADAVAVVKLPRLERGRHVDVQAQVQAKEPERTYVIDGTVTAQLRPDLVVAAIHAPLQTLTTRPVDVVADIAEVRGDTGATAQVTLAGAIAPLQGPIAVTVPAGGHVSVTFAGVALTEPLATELRVIVSDASPGEYDSENQMRAATVEVTKSEMTQSVLVPSLGGYGFQFNQHLFASITSPNPASLPDLDAKVKALEPQLVRIFYNENWEANADGTHAPDAAANLQSFKDVVKMANDAGATIVVTYQSTTFAKAKPALWMGRFADVLKGLVDSGNTNVRWAVIGNEPNSSALTKDQYRQLYTELHAALVARGLHSIPGSASDQIRLIAGDLVQLTEGTAAGHRAWFDYMVTNMNDLADAWSEHIYWNYSDHRRMEERLKDVAHIVNTELPAEARKPTFILEYGVRGNDSCGTKPKVTAAYYGDDACTELRTMSLAGFHKLWFNILSAQLGFEGASNWDLYYAIYDKTKNNQSYWAMAPIGEQWELYPSYYALQLLNQTTARGWHILSVNPFDNSDAAESTLDRDHWIWDDLEQELTAYAGPDTQLTIVGLDTRGDGLTAPNSESSYSIGGLPPSTSLALVVWNAGGDGRNTVAKTVTTGTAGVARFDVPLQAAFALTTVPIS